MKRTLDKKQSILVLLLMSIFSLFIVIFSLKVLNQAKDLNLEADMARINVSLIEYYIDNNVFPTEKLCNLKKDCSNFRKKIIVAVNKDIYYNSNEKDYILYSPSFVNKKIYYVTGPDLIIKRSLEAPEL
ncbi:MAG TPA: hypothetical protein PKU93_03310 [Candidatus Pacearchaeota archaeon]|nr:hypothetical protein [Candidatus Pacearchaeota archaeon]